MRGYVALCVFALTAAVMAGCLADRPDTAAVPPALEHLTTKRMDDLALQTPDMLLWSGVNLREGDVPDGQLCHASCVPEGCVGAGCVPSTCPDGSCASYPFLLEPRTGAELAVALRFPTERGLEMRAWLVDDRGNGLAEFADSGYGFSVAKAATLASPAAGGYGVVVHQTAGSGPHEVVVRLQSTGAPDGAGLVLPDLVTMPPTDLTFERPAESMGPFPLPGRPVHDVLAGTAAAPGCTFEEHANYAPVKCLRFTNAVGNAGEGPLRLTLGPVDAATFGTSGRWTQYVLTDDGSWSARRAGPTEFHVNHAHWHDAVSNHYAVYQVDEATAERGAELGVGRKTGVCFADIGVVALNVSRIAVPTENGTRCFVPDAEGYHTGLTPGWYDSYPWVLADQFVDMGDAPDGVYDLCTTSNAEGTLLETTVANNGGCTRFRMTGLEIEVLDPLPYHADSGAAWG